MKNLTFLDHLSKEDREEYLEIINQFKQEFKKKIQDELSIIRKDLAKNTAEILGIEFAKLLNERKELLLNFKACGKKLLMVAKEYGFNTQLKNLQKWSEQVKKDNGAKTEGSELFQEVLNAVSDCNPALTEEVSKIQLQLSKNAELLAQIVKDKKSLIDKAQSSYRAPLQKKIVDLLVEFNKKITVVNQSFNVQNTKPLSPFDEGDKISVENGFSAKIAENLDDIGGNFDDELFIPISGDDDLN